VKRKIPSQSRLIQLSLGAIWALGGALMAFNPPPPGSRRTEQLPAIGCLVLVGGIYFAAKALRTPDVENSGKPPRHASGAEARKHDNLKLALGFALCVVGGVGTVWWGISSGLLSAVGLGIATLGISVLAIPSAASASNRWLRRGKRRAKPADMTTNPGHDLP
jgi:hypothetical protein